MHIELLVKLSPESKEDALRFAEHLEAFKMYFDELKERGGLPPETQVRWLLKTRRFE